MSYNIRLLIDCPDHKGVIAAVSSFISLHNGNILSADQHVSGPPNGTFFMRMEIEGRGFGLGRDEFDACKPAPPAASAPDELGAFASPTDRSAWRSWFRNTGIV